LQFIVGGGDRESECDNVKRSSIIRSQRRWVTLTRNFKDSVQLMMKIQQRWKPLLEIDLATKKFEDDKKTRSIGTTISKRTMLDRNKRSKKPQHSLTTSILATRIRLSVQLSQNDLRDEA
jgi:hypothetical protein